MSARQRYIRAAEYVLLTMDYDDDEVEITREVAEDGTLTISFDGPDGTAVMTVEGVGE